MKVYLTFACWSALSLPASTLALTLMKGGSVIGRGGVRGTYSSMLSASTISTDPTSFLLGEVTDSGVPNAPTTPALRR